MEEKYLLDEAMEEIHGAKHYAKCAMKWREKDPVKAKKYFDLAQDELRHADTLYHMAEGGNPTRSELEAAFLCDMREQYAEKLAHVKAMLEAFRGN